ncbi:MAG: hypothetical protein V5B78_08475 [Desulfohalobiaceae bacterium]
MPDIGWIPSELILPREGREVLTCSRHNWGLKKGDQTEGKGYDSAHRRIEVHSWKPRAEKSPEEDVATMQYGPARACLSRIIDSCAKGEQP